METFIGNNEVIFEQLRQKLRSTGNKACVHSFGCQLNVSDGEKIKGVLRKIGYSFTNSYSDADLIMLNTCAVRENAEDKVFGIIGSIKHLKEINPDLIIGISGCMSAQEHIVEKIKKSYPQVDIVVGTSAITLLPKLLLECLDGKKFSADIIEYDSFSENCEQVRESSFKASVPIMFGCNNFCTYCIVPYVRGRERSRNACDIINEVTNLVHNGYKEIMLLGQNVNSYGNDLQDGISFPELLIRLNSIEGDFIIRFMSSHPKDVSDELIDAMSECKKVEKHLHLPVQSGSNSILLAMNRRYTVEKYMGIINRLREKNPEFSVTTDIIVGFPNESDYDFEQTIKLLQNVRYDNVFSFIYSKRTGTKAAAIDDKISEEIKGKRMRHLLEVQCTIAGENYKRFQNKIIRVLVDGECHRKQGFLNGKSDEFIIVEFEGDESLIGTFVNVRITKTMSRSLYGEIVQKG